MKINQTLRRMLGSTTRAGIFDRQAHKLAKAPKRRVMSRMVARCITVADSLTGSRP